MKKRLMIMSLTMFMSYAHASACGSSCSASGANCDKAACVATLSTEETTFISKLGAAQAKAFSLMDAEQRHEVLMAACQAETTPDAAVDSFLNKHHLAVVDGVLKAKTSDVK